MQRNAFSYSMISALCLSVLATGAQACAQRDAAIAAVDAQDFTAVEGYFDDIVVSADCDDALRDWLAGQLANDAMRAAIYDAGTNAERRAALERSLVFQEHWRAYWGLGRVARDEGDRNGEAAYLQTAINQLNDGPQDHTATEVEIRQLLAEATVAVQLSDGIVETPRTRSGTLGGIFSAEVRGFVVEEVVLDVEFAFDSAELTPDGEALARQFAQSANEQGLARFTIKGHTDPVGDAGYNMGLSIRRAEAVRDFIQAQSLYSGTIEIIGMGETEPPTLPEGWAGGEDEMNQIARRVEFERG